MRLWGAARGPWACGLALGQLQRDLGGQTSGRELCRVGRGLKGREGNPETESACSRGDKRHPGPLDGGSGVHGHTSSSERASPSQG